MGGGLINQLDDMDRCNRGVLLAESIAELEELKAIGISRTAQTAEQQWNLKAIMNRIKQYKAICDKFIDTNFKKFLRDY